MDIPFYSRAQKFHINGVIWYQQQRNQTIAKGTIIIFLTRDSWNKNFLIFGYQKGCKIFFENQRDYPFGTNLSKTLREMENGKASGRALGPLDTWAGFKFKKEKIAST